MTPEGPCSWPYDPCPCEPLEAMPEAEQTEIVGLASWLLWAATFRLFGPCPVSIMPCQTGCACGASWRRCGCSTPAEVKLAGPVHSITEVMIDGVVLDDETYRVDDWQWLVRLDGQKWPAQNVEDPTAFRVDYLLGIEPPAGAGTITGILASELAKARCGDKTCRLPARVRTVQKQGITMSFGSAGGGGASRLATIVDIGFGLPEVDDWIRAVNSPAVMAGAVWSPDMPTYRRITWQAS